MSIWDGVNDLIHHSINTPDRSMSALCHLPKCSVGTFYPSPLNHSYLALPYFCQWGEEKKVGLDMPIMLNRHMLVRCLHQWQTDGGNEAVLPPIFSKDPGVPGTLEVGYMGPMWTNTQYTSAVPTGGTGLQGSKPTLSEVTFCADEFNTKRSLAPLTGAGIVYSAEWYDKDGKLLEHLTTRKPDGDELMEGSKPGDGAPPPPTPHDPAKVSSDNEGAKPNKEDNDDAKSNNDDDDAKSNDDEDDAKSKQASDSDSGSGSGSGDSGSSSGSEDSSKDSSSSKSSKNDSGSQSEGQSDVPKHKVRQKKKAR